MVLFFFSSSYNRSCLYDKNRIILLVDDAVVTMIASRRSAITCLYTRKLKAARASGKNGVLQDNVLYAYWVYSSITYCEEGTRLLVQYNLVNNGVLLLGIAEASVLYLQQTAYEGTYCTTNIRSTAMSGNSGERTKKFVSSFASITVHSRIYLQLAVNVLTLLNVL